MVKKINKLEHTNNSIFGCGSDDFPGKFMVFGG